LANIKSQIKRNKQNEKRRIRNRVYRGSARIAVRNARSVMTSENTEETPAAVLQAISALDKAAEKGVIHKNNAARRKGRLMKRMAALNVELKATKVEKPKAEEEVVKEDKPKKTASKKATSKKTTKKADTKKATKKSTAKKADSKKTSKKS
jgi:small subunit ribosomal protein S20